MDSNIRNFSDSIFKDIIQITLKVGEVWRAEGMNISDLAGNALYSAIIGAVVTLVLIIMFFVGGIFGLGFVSLGALGGLGMIYLKITGKA